MARTTISNDGRRLELLVSVGVLAVGRLARDLHDDQGDDVVGEVRQGVKGIAEDRKRAGGEPDSGLGDENGEVTGALHDEDVAYFRRHGRLILMHRQHRNLGYAHHFFCHAPDQEMVQPAEPPRAHDHELRIDVFADDDARDRLSFESIVGESDAIQEAVRVGVVQDLKVDVRVIASSNRDLKKMIEAETFRRDLFYRLNVITISLPRLRDRGDDVRLLAKCAGSALGSRSPEPSSTLTAGRFPWSRPPRGYRIRNFAPAPELGRGGRQAADSWSW